MSPKLLPFTKEQFAFYEAARALAAFFIDCDDAREPRKDYQDRWDLLEEEFLIAFQRMEPVPPYRGID